MNFRCYPVVIEERRSGCCRPRGLLNPRGPEPRPYIIPYNLTGLTRVRTKLHRFRCEHYTEADLHVARNTRCLDTTTVITLTCSCTDVSNVHYWCFNCYYLQRCIKSLSGNWQCVAISIPQRLAHFVLVCLTCYRRPILPIKLRKCIAYSVGDKYYKIPNKLYFI